LAGLGCVGKRFLQGIYPRGAVLEQSIALFKVFLGGFPVAVALFPGKPYFLGMVDMIDDLVLAIITGIIVL
jgi:hypothetical protein